MFFINAYRRPAIFNITIKGQISESDAAKLLEHLDSKNLLPKNGNTYQTTHYNDGRELSALGRKIQEEVALFFNNL